MPAAFLLGGGPDFSQLLTELVVHSLKWSTSSCLSPGFLPFSRFLAELVVHSPEWATGSRLLPSFRAFSPASDPASGPLSRVDHWHMAFPLFSALFPGF